MGTWEVLPSAWLLLALLSPSQTAVAGECPCSLVL